MLDFELVYLLTKRNLVRITIWVFITLALFPIVLAFLVLHGFHISTEYVITGAAVYSSIWFGVYGSVLVNEDLHNGFMSHLILTNRLRIYLFSSLLLSFALSLVTNLILFLLFQIPPHPILIPVAFLCCLIPLLVSLPFTFWLKMGNTNFVEIQNVIFALLAFSANTLIPVATGLMFLNPVFDVVTLLRNF